MDGAAARLGDGRRTDGCSIRRRRGAFDALSGSMTEVMPNYPDFVDDAHRAFNVLGKHMLLGRLGVLP